MLSCCCFLNHNNCVRMCLTSTTTTTTTTFLTITNEDLLTMLLNTDATMPRFLVRLNSVKRDHDAHSSGITDGRAEAAGHALPHDLPPVASGQLAQQREGLSRHPCVAQPARAQRGRQPVVLADAPVTGSQSAPEHNDKHAHFPEIFTMLSDNKAMDAACNNVNELTALMVLQT